MSKVSTVKQLEDGRTFFTTHNGFKKFITDKGITTPVSHNYYQTLLRLFRKQNSKKYKRSKNESR